ncbi:MAG: hypothetical protein GY915_05640 [bacterium]|nr:hypothetical protein [bacterium]
MKGSIKKILVIGLLSLPFLSLGNRWFEQSNSEYTLEPWNNIGGCGAGGSGGGSGDGIQWIGEGVSGGLVDLEVLPKFSAGQNFSNFSISPRFSFHPTYSTTLGLSMPFQSKSGEVQYRGNQLPNDRTTGGSGDLSLDLGMTAGSSGQYQLTLGMGFPTGQYDIKRGKDGEEEFLPSSLQKGGGVYNLSLGLSKSQDTEEGIWLYSLSLSWPYIVSFTGKNDQMETYFSEYSEFKKEDRFYYYFKAYGENDFGDYTPPSVSGSLFYGYRGQEEYVHSFGMTFGAPLGVAWIRNEKVGVYDPRPDADHKSWNMAFVYGLEFSKEEFPLFFGFSLPLHAASAEASSDEYDASAFENWQAPDWGDFLQQFNLAFGFKTTFL